MNGILIPQPVRAFDRIIHVTSPVIFMHVSQSSVDPALGGNSMTTGWEKLGDAGSVESCFSQAKCGAQASTAGTDD